MSEKLPDTPDWRAEIENYFSNNPESDPRLREYRERGYIFTNNLHLYIRDDAPELSPGVPDPYDYRHRSFAPAVQRLHDEHPDLWQETKKASQARHELSSQYWNLISETKSDGSIKVKTDAIESEEAKAIYRQAESMQWTEAKALTKVIETLAPWLLEIGIRPVKLCS